MNETHEGTHDFQAIVASQVVVTQFDAPAEMAHGIGEVLELIAIVFSGLSQQVGGFS